MKFRRSALAAAMLFVIPAIANGGTRPGTWSTYAHDFQRSARADGKGAMKNPVVAWTERLGANLSAREVLFADLDGDGRPDAATIDGGRVVASASTGGTIWNGPLDAPHALLGVWNLDGAKAPELVVQTSRGVEILDGATGSVDTTLPDTGTLGATFVSLGANGGVLAIAAAKGVVNAYDFRGTLNPNGTLWSIANDNPSSFMVGDVDGDSLPDIVRPLDDGFDVLNPTTGAVKYGPVHLDSIAWGYLAELADLDGKPGLEIVAVDYSYLYSPSAGVFAIGVSNGTLQVLWKSYVAATAALATDFYTVANSATDLDMDGKVEVAYSQWDDQNSQWTTHVVDGASGTMLSSAAGLLEAVVDIDGDGKLELLIRDTPSADRTPSRTALRAYDYDNRVTGLVAKPWSLKASRVMTIGSGQPAGTSVGLSMPVTGDFDVTSAGNEALVATDTSNSNADTQIATLRSDGATSATVAIAPNTAISVLCHADKLSAPSSTDDVALFSNDGVIHVDDKTLKPATTFNAGSFATPFYVAALSAGKSAVFAPTSTRALRWLDGTHLHAAGDPYVLTTVENTVPSSSWGLGGWAFDPVVPLDSSSPVFVVYEQKDGNLSLVALDATGIEVWRTPLAAGTQLLPPGSYANDYTGDGIPDLLVTLQNVHGLESIALFDGLNGNVVKSTPLASIEPQSDQLSQGSLIDVNGDGVLDLVGSIQTRGTVAIDVTTSPMSAIWLLPSNQVAYDMGTIGAGVFGTSGADLYRAGGDDGFGLYARISTAGGVLASNDEGFNGQPGNDRNHVALVTRSGSSQDLVSVGMAPPVLSRVSRIAGDTLQNVWIRYAKNGAVTTAQPADPVALHDPLEVDVDGDGVEDVVFGGDDGYVYALRSTDGSLVFAVNVGVPVEFVVAADIDKDPELELVAGLADGRLVALDDPGNYDADVDQPDGGVDDAGADTSADGGAPDAGCPNPSNGGCTCSNSAMGSSSPASALIGILAVGLFLLRRRHS